MADVKCKGRIDCLCDWCCEMRDRHPNECEVCLSFAANGGGTGAENAGDCYLHQNWKPRLMAKVILTMEDSEDGGVKLTLDSDPPFDMVDMDNNTDAQCAGLIAIGAIRDSANRPSEVRCDDCRPLYGQCSVCALKEASR